MKSLRDGHFETRCQIKLANALGRDLVDIWNAKQFIVVCTSFTITIQTPDIA